MAKYMQTTVDLAGIPVFVDFAIEHNGKVNYAEASFGGKYAFDEGFLSPALEERLDNECRAYAAKCDAEASYLRKAA